MINFISKTGQREGGAIQGTIGVDLRLIASTSIMVLRLPTTSISTSVASTAPAKARVILDITATMCGQIKANITKEFDGGYIRFHAKFLDDSTPTILPQPVAVSGTDGNPDYTAIAGFDPRTDSLYSPFITTITTLDGGNNPTTYNFQDGLRLNRRRLALRQK